MALDTSALARRLQGKTQYDLKRESLQAQGEKERAESVKRSQTESTERGFGKGSGYQEALARKADIQARKQTAVKTGAVDIAELGAEESRQEAERQRTYASEEAEKGRTWQTGERIGSQEYSSGEAEKTRTWQSSENQKSVDAALERLKLQGVQATELAKLQDEIAKGQMSYQDVLNQENALREKKSTAAYNVGLSGGVENPNWTEAEKASYQAGLSGKSKEDADRAYSEKITESERGYQKEIIGLNQQNQIKLADINNQMETGRLYLQNLLDKEKETRTQKATAAYNVGMSGGTPNPLWTDAEKAAYESGKSGKSISDAEKAYQEKIDLRNAALTTLDPTRFVGREQEFIDMIKAIFEGKPLNNQSTNTNNETKTIQTTTKRYKGNPKG